MTSSPPAIGPARYAAWRASPLGAATEAIEREALFALAGEVTGKRALDIGCGDGALAAILRERGADVAGIDADPLMIEAARRRLPDADFRVADAVSLPFPDGSFDLAFLVTVLCLAGNRGAILREAARVLKPGGRLVVGELGRFSPWAAWRRVKGWLGSATWRRAAFATPAELRYDLEGAGLEVVGMRVAVHYPPFAWTVRFETLLARRLPGLAAFLAAVAAKQGDQTS